MVKTVWDEILLGVRNPFGGQGEGERMDSLQEKQAELGDNKKKDVSQDISSSASYEEESQDETVILDSGGGEQAAAPASSGGGTQLIPLSVDKLTLVNSQYELQSTAALYKV